MPLSDAMILAALDLRQRDPSLTYAEIGAAVGCCPQALGRALNAIDLATEPSRHDGSMPPGWWRDGLERQRERAE